jgi:hypothetical protein
MANFAALAEAVIGIADPGCILSPLVNALFEAVVV